MEEEKPKSRKLGKEDTKEVITEPTRTHQADWRQMRSVRQKKQHAIEPRGVKDQGAFGTL